MPNLDVFKNAEISESYISVPAVWYLTPRGEAEADDERFDGKTME